MDSRTSVHIIKTACHVVVAAFVCPAALCADHYLRCLILILMSHEFIDATTGTVLFTVKQADAYFSLLPVYIGPVPFHNPLG
ncbi:hypothetical protein Pelo_7855 [Pelomyxa schiedti]|nr:hypothetical protein Pelo_7855 [Pelomyxa schiedti]